LLAAVCCGCQAAEESWQDGPSGTQQASVDPGLEFSYSSPLAGETPFGPYLPYVNGPSDGSREADLAAEEAAFNAEEAAIAECMKAQGFDYTPAEWQAEEVAVYFPDGDKLRLPSLPPEREDAATRGYGVAGPQTLLAGLVDTERANADYYESLNVGQQAAYDLAWAGPVDSSGMWNSSDYGCLGVGEDAVLSSSPSVSSSREFWVAFGDLARAMDQLPVLDDPAVHEADRDFDRCMFDKGFDLTSGAEFSAGQGGPWAAWTMALRTKEDGTLGDSWHTDWLAAGQMPPEDELSLLGTAAEIKIAVADFECRAEVDYAARFREAHLRLEDEFVGERKAELEEMKAFVQEHTG
jgi:hypothetical protein